MSLHIGTTASPDAIAVDMEGPALRLGGAVDRLATGFGLGRCADRAGMTIERLLSGEARDPAQALESACAAYNLAEAVGEDLADVQVLLRQVRTFVEEWQYALSGAGDRASVRLAIEQLSFEVEYLGVQADFKGRRLYDVVVALADQIGAGSAEDDGADAELPEAFEPIRTGRTDVFEIDTALAQVAAQCATAGGLQHRLEFVVNRLAGPHGELVGAEREIRDAIPAQAHAWSADPSGGQQRDSAVLAQAPPASQDLLSLLG